jgi:hypothetical protein
LCHRLLNNRTDDSHYRWTKKWGAGQPLGLYRPFREATPGKAPVEGGDLRSCSVVFLFSETAPEEPFTAAEGG